jgi:hypothetical protein
VFGAIEQEVVAADAAVERGQGLLPGA